MATAGVTRFDDADAVKYDDAAAAAAAGSWKRRVPGGGGGPTRCTDAGSVLRGCIFG
jgi:hypothetical protein